MVLSARDGVRSADAHYTCETLAKWRDKMASK